MKDLSSKQGIIPADQLQEWQAWTPGALETPGAFKGLTAAQAQALTASLGESPDPLESAAATPSVEPLPVPDELDDAEPAQHHGYPTAAELESIHQEAWQGGYDAGLQAGHEEGMAAGLEAGRASGLEAVQQQFAEAWAPLQALSGQFASALEQLETQLSVELLELAVRMAERLVAAHLACDPKAIEPLLRETLAKLPTILAEGRVRVHPADLEVARTVLGEARPETLWQWVEDPALARGSCMLETPSLRQNLTLATRMQAMAAALGLARETEATLEAEDDAG